AQREAARTYQEWGRKKAAYYGLAIAGARKVKGAAGREENVIWGWNRLAIMVQRDKRFSDVFHEARYNLAQSRFDLAMAADGSDKIEGLKRAEFDIMLTSRLRPDMGGDEWRKKYDSLLRTIQQAQGQRPTGLPAERVQSRQPPDTQGETRPAGPQVTSRPTVK
ncbi:MAG: hypothetical protein WD278_20705, partial [Pirellulales bacterium]